MPKLVNYTLADVANIQARLRSELKGCASLQEAAQRCAGVLYEDHRESLALVRLYATIPFGQLPAADTSFVNALAVSNGAATPLRGDMLVLSLLGTRGREADWDDRYKSKGHLGIPLVGASFVGAIPMVARLMHDMGLGLDWLDKSDTRIVLKTLGRAAGVFYVRSAEAGTDEQGRKIVPAQDFVRGNRIETVFGLGGSYLNGTCVIMILFARETLERTEVEKFMPLVSTFKSLTLGLVMSGEILARRAV